MSMVMWILEPLRRLAPFRPARWRGLEGAAVEDHGRGSGLAPGKVVQEQAQVADHGLVRAPGRYQHAGFAPALGLLADDLSGRKDVRQRAPERVELKMMKRKPLNPSCRSCRR